MAVLLYFGFALIGACVGSFLNVCIDRILARVSLAFPPSHCDACGRRLRPLELVPVFSYLLLRGRCRDCGSRIKLRVLWVEIGGAVVLPLLYVMFGLSAALVVAAAYCAVLAVVGIIDLETGLIPNRIIYPSAVAVLVLDFILPQPGIFSALVGGVAVPALLGIAAWLGAVIIRKSFDESMGMGDIKLVALIGLMTGWQLGLVALVLGVVLGGIISIVLLIFRLRDRKDTIPFGPYLSVGAIITLLWGGNILNFYLGLFPRLA